MAAGENLMNVKIINLLKIQSYMRAGSTPTRKKKERRSETETEDKFNQISEMKLNVLLMRNFFTNFLRY